MKVEYFNFNSNKNEWCSKFKEEALSEKPADFLEVTVLKEKAAFIKASFVENIEKNKIN